MKKPVLQSSSLFLLLMVLFTVVFMAAECEKPVENSSFVSVQQTSNDTSQLQGTTWQLTKVEGGFFAAQYNGEIIWHINQDQIAVTIADSVNYPLPQPDSMGFYSYITHNDSLKLINNNNGMIEEYQYILSPTTLILNEDLSACGKQYLFTKIK
jgi:hypothetical protein